MTRSSNNPQAIDPFNPATPDIGGSGFSNPLDATLKFSGNISLQASTYLQLFNSTTQTITGGNIPISFDTILSVSPTWGPITLPAVGFTAPFTGIYFVALKVYWNPGVSGAARTRWINIPGNGNNYCYEQFNNVGVKTCASSQSGPIFINAGGFATCYSQFSDSATSILIGDDNGGSINDYSTALYVYYIGVQ